MAEGKIALRNKRTGEIVYVDAPGAAPAVVPIGPRNPKPAADMANEAERIRLANEANRRAEEDQRMQRERFQWEARQRDLDRQVGKEAAVREGEDKAGSFLIRALGANNQYRAVDPGPRSWLGQVLADTAPNFLNSLPSAIGNSPRRQISDSAQEEFVAASLRQDSGAAIPDEELERQRRIYFPMPGDGPSVIRQKENARNRAIEGLKMSAGRRAPVALERLAQGPRLAAAPGVNADQYGRAELENRIAGLAPRFQEMARRDYERRRAARKKTAPKVDDEVAGYLKKYGGR